MSRCERIGPQLDAFHDGELGGLRRRAVQWHLDRCPACREELASLRGIGNWVRDAVESAPAPDVWNDIRWRLPVERSGPTRERSRSGTRSRGLTFGVPALGVGVAAAATALLLLVGPPEPIGAEPGSVVRSLNTHGRPVMVLDGRPGDATVIWLMDEGGAASAEDGSSVWI